MADDERKRRRGDEGEDEALPEKGRKEKKEKKKKQDEVQDGLVDEEEKKEKKDKKDKKENKDKKEKKPHPVLKTFFNTSVFWLVCILTFSALTYLNIFTLKEIVLQALNPEEDYEVVFESDIQAMRDYETELDNRAAEYDEMEAQLSDYETELNNRESELDMLQLDLEEKYPQAFEDGTQDTTKTVDISSVAKGLAEMDPAAAAAALVLVGQDTAVSLLNALKPDARGAILSKMTPEDVAMIFEMMVQPE